LAATPTTFGAGEAGGPRSGVLNAETRELLKMWVERDWHCPVVVEDRTLSSARLTALRDAGPSTNRTATVLAGAVNDQNVWRARQVRAGSFVVWDHTGRATVEPYRQGQPMVLCRYVSASRGGAGVFQRSASGRTPRWVGADGPH